ncbi:P-loop containing nucleoside triphosphate hydrolase protein [Cristinia sonorae]|uniref:RNA helicase n=1 Tax=Cristinia sonorae TaxID=1940300 RepID=A0A8K0XSQ7_9AGAR|nr:P-loop containing nucleoside triphosphate hydrolase protein [Cristinia sonorae]
MNRTRERFNAKARQSTAGSSHKKKKRTKASTEDPADRPSEAYSDPNAEIIVPKSEEAKEADRKERLRQELIVQSNSKVSTKKKKRLEKYIEKKLKAEERVVLFDKLSKSQAQLPNALGLQSSATLGTGVAKTHMERLEKDEDKDVRRALDGSSQKKGGKKRKRQPTLAVQSGMTDESSDSDVEMRSADEMEDGEAGKTRSNPVVIVDSGFSTAPAPQSTSLVTKISEVGSALQRNPDGSVVAPKISKRKPKQGKFASWGRSRLNKQARDAGSDTSFDSSDSAYDSNSEDDAREQDNGMGSSSDDEGEGEEGSEEDSSEAEEEEEEAPPPPKRKKTGFKEWAMQQLSSAKGYVAPVPSADSELLPEPELAAPPPKKRKKDPGEVPGEMRGPLGQDLVLPNTAFAQQLQESKRNGESKLAPRRVVLVNRPPDVDEARLLLPIVAEEQPIMEAILLNSVVIICGETGSGKTTQVPQFLYEAGFGLPGGDNPGMIGITQPRRVAAMSMAARVAHELSLTSSKVSYQIRYDATVSPDTSIKFMTDGVLLRELATDFLLTKYSVIIIDEAHERSMNTDILIGVLSRVVKLREQMWLENKGEVKPLRLIIMSATLRVSDFAENTTLFSTPPPIINVAARQHPVTIHFSRRTQPDYVNEAIRKASKIHSRLPPGGILIFLTGQNEIAGVCRKLEARYGAKALEQKKQRRSQKVQQETEASAVEQTLLPKNVDVEAEDVELGVSEVQDIALDVDGDLGDVADDEDALDSDGDEDNEALGIDAEESDTPMHIVPLYALLPSEKQMRVFQPPPSDHRLVVVSTNVAETSLTIPGIRYVVDCGRAKERRYDVANGIQSFQVSWVSKASAAQRAGRAGRTGPGHCYRLYSSALFENYFEQFSQPEIVRMPIEGVVLQMKSMHVDSVINFPFPTPPDRTSLRKAETVLTHLGALKSSAGGIVGDGEITEVGKAMSLFPLSPRYGRMLVSGRQHGCMPYLITVVAALSVGDPFLREENIEAGDEEKEDEDEDEELAHLTGEAARAKEARRIRRKAFFQNQQLHASLGSHSSDVFRVLSVVGAYEYAGGGHKFCEDHFVRPKAMEEIHKLRAQINSIAQSNFPDVDIGFSSSLKPPSALQLKVLRQLLTAGFIDQVAVRKDKVLKDGSGGQKYTTSKGVAYQAMGISEDVFIHPSSVLFGMPPPEFIVFTETVRTSRVWMKGVTVINPAWLPSLGKSMCTYSKPVKNKEGISMVIPRYGPFGWELPAIKEPVS